MAEPHGLSGVRKRTSDEAGGLARTSGAAHYFEAADRSTHWGVRKMDRRSFLGLFGGLAAAVVLLETSPSEAMPAAKPSDVAPAAPEPAVATDADMESVKPEKAYWRRRRVYRRYYRRRYWRRRYYYRPRYYYRRRYYWRPRYYYRWW
ncbi:MAG TPA: hypothetical protein PKA55_07200 [Rhodoblastus sp.]|nr:hypothetical protein [Rhodoblastus sp.]